MSAFETRVLRAFGLMVRIESDAPGLFALVERQLPEFPVVESDEALLAPADLSYRVHVRTESGVAVIRGRRTVATVEDVPAACDRLVIDFQSALARRAAGRTFVHAGVVVIDGEALLLPARSRTGKSTLVAALLAAGASYGSDAFAVIDLDGYVHPYSRRLARRTRYPAVSHVPAGLFGGAAPAERLPVAAVLFTEFRQGATLEMTRLTPGEVVLRLLQHCLGVRGRPDETFTALSAVSHRAAGFVGDRGDAAIEAPALVARARYGWHR